MWVISRMQYMHRILPWLIIFLAQLRERSAIEERDGKPIEYLLATPIHLDLSKGTTHLCMETEIYKTFIRF